MHGLLILINNEAPCGACLFNAVVRYTTSNAAPLIVTVCVPTYLYVDKEEPGLVKLYSTL